MQTQIIAAYDDQTIWGVSTSPEAAIEDACQWVEAWREDKMRSTLKTAPMSDRLTRHVAAVGGDCRFALGEDGVLFLDTDD
jgi:hypothetical protein